MQSVGASTEDFTASQLAAMIAEARRYDQKAMAEARSRDAAKIDAAWKEHQERLARAQAAPQSQNFGPPHL
jgi:hypothetical protein